MEPSTPPNEVQAYYAAFPEESRLQWGASQLEYERTKEILTRVLPASPARILDVGGAAGAYSLWLAGRGYQVHLVDASQRLVDEARTRSAKSTHPIASLMVADARQLPSGNDAFDAVLVMGPLYHLPNQADRVTALREAYRVVIRSGIVAVAAISRYASTLDGLCRKLSLDPQFVRIRDQDLVDGQHRNNTGKLDYFTTAYFHRPADLHAELEAAGFQHVSVLGVEGPAWLLADFDARWQDVALRQDLLDVARLLEAEPSIHAVSAHLLAIGRKP